MADLHNLLFNMKFAAKQMDKSAKKAEKDSLKERGHVKRCLAKGNVDAAKIHAESAIRKHNEGLNFMRLGARLDAAASKVNTAAQMRTVTKVMAGTVKGMDKILQGMDPLAITRVMDSFESQVGNLEATTTVMESAFSNADASTVPVGEVDTLLEQLRAEQNMEISGKIASAAGVGLDPLETQEKEMEETLARLNNRKIGA